MQLVAQFEREIPQNPNEARLFEVEHMKRILNNELNDTKFDPTSPLNVMARLNRAVVLGGEVSEVLENASPGRVVTIVEGIDTVAQFAFALHTFDHLAGIVESSLEETVYLNITECDEGEEVSLKIRKIICADQEIVDRIIEGGKRKGIEKALEFMRDSVKLIFYKKEEIDQIAVEYLLDGGSEYRLPTKLDGVKVSYFYPEDEQVPSISLMVSPL